jgi:hypothetical protein
MSRRNVWLKFDEWELINKELSDQKYHRFQLSKRQVDEWKKDMKKYPSSSFDSYKFERTGVYPAIEQVKSPRAVNILCRENWRSQDMYSTMRDTHDFIGFILTHCDDVDMDTTVEEWDDIRNKMRHLIENSDKRIWFYDDLIELYKEVTA